MADMYVARESFFAVIDGQETMVRRGRDLVRAGHPILERYPNMFIPAPVRFDVEQATAAPGEKRGAPMPTPAPESASEDVEAEKPRPAVKTTRKRDD